MFKIIESIATLFRIETFIHVVITVGSLNNRQLGELS